MTSKPRRHRPTHEDVPAEAPEPVADAPVELPPARDGAPRGAGVSVDAVGMIEEAFLGERATLRRSDVANTPGVDFDRARTLWRTLGLVASNGDDVAFTPADVRALKNSDRLVASGLVTEEGAELLARTMGQALSTLAQAQVETVADRLAGLPGAIDLARKDPELLVKLALARTDEYVAPMEELLVYVWRRHLVAAAGRTLTGVSTVLGTEPVAIGFVDLVGFTGLTAGLDNAELSTLVETFESRATAAVVDHGGRVVKTLGDEVMFTCPSPVAAAFTALDLAEELRTTPDVPEVRAGLAYGPVLSRAGDVYGPVVNVASRCTSLAHPGTVVIDRGMAAALADFSGLVVKEMRPRKVRGYDRLAVSVLRRA